MKKMLFIDRDGTIIKEPTDNFQVDRPEKLEFMPGVIGALREITGNTDFRLVMVSNQDGLGTADFPMEDFMLPQTLMLRCWKVKGSFSTRYVSIRAGRKNIPVLENPE